jgi:hypothetical protein
MEIIVSESFSNNRDAGLVLWNYCFGCGASRIPFESASLVLVHLVLAPTFVPPRRDEHPEQPGCTPRNEWKAPASSPASRSLRQKTRPPTMSPPPTQKEYHERIINVKKKNGGLII